MFLALCANICVYCVDIRVAMRPKLVVIVTTHNVCSTDTINAEKYSNFDTSALWGPNNSCNFFLSQKLMYPQLPTHSRSTDMVDSL